MSANYESVLADDAAAVLSVDGEFSEAVTLILRGGATRDVYALIDRDPPVRLSGTGEAFKPSAALILRNHASLGVLVSEVEGLKARFSTRKGSTNDAFYREWAMKLADDNAIDAGVIRFEV